MNLFQTAALFYIIDQNNRISNLEEQVEKQNLKEASRTVIQNDYTNISINEQEHYPYEMDNRSKKVWNFICTFKEEDFTAQNIADATGLGIKSVNGIITGFQKRGFTIREKVLSNNGFPITYIRLNSYYHN